MKVQIRHGVFETNSSSIHSLTICPLGDFNAFRKGDLVVEVNSIQSSRWNLVRTDSVAPEKVYSATNYDDDIYNYEYATFDAIMENAESSLFETIGDEWMVISMYSYDY